VSDYEKGAYEFVEQKYPKAFETLKTKKAIDDELKGVLEKAFTEYSSQFV
jgi:F0F1-type ATP synthase alpha subunit